MAHHQSPGTPQYAVSTRVSAEGAMAGDGRTDPGTLHDLPEFTAFRFRRRACWRHSMGGLLDRL
jgi:hypothetical protein